MNKKIINLILIIFIILAVSSCGFLNDKNVLKITFLDAPSTPVDGNFKGIGQCALIQTPGGKNYIVDAGLAGSYEYIIRPYLRENNIDVIHGLVITHPHGDHYGGAIELIKNEKVNEIYTNGEILPSYLYKNFLDTAREHDVNFYNVLKTGDDIMFDEELKGKVINAFRPEYADNINNSSIVIALSYGKVNVLLTGDAEMAAENFMVKNYKDYLKADILQAAHHGSASSTSMNFLNIVRPTAAVIQAGNPNSYGFPAPSTLANLNDFGTDIYRNDIHGNITFIITKRGYTVQTQTQKDAVAAANTPKLTENYVEAKILSDEGWRLIREKKNEEALIKLIAAEKLYKEDAAVYSRLGYAYKLTGNRAAAKENFLRALELDGEEAYAHLHLGLHYAHIERDKKKAAFHLEKFLEIRPDDYSASVAKNVLAALKK